MRLFAKALLGANKGIVLPTFTGTYELAGDATKGYVKLLSDGVLTLSPADYDVCIVGSGGGGGCSLAGAGTSPNRGGEGARGGYVTNLFAQALAGDYAVVIGAGGIGRATSYSNANSSAGNPSSIGDMTAVGADTSDTSGGGRGNGGSGYKTTAGIVYATPGEDGVHPFADIAGFPDLVSGTGGGGNGTATTKPGGGGGGGAGGAGGDTSTAGSAGTANTGAGGGGGGAHKSPSGTNRKAGGNGGSGVAFVRWGY